MEQDMPGLGSNPTKYYFTYGEGTVSLKMVEGYEAELYIYTQAYLNKLNAAFSLQSESTTLWSHFYNFGSFELELVLSLGVAEFNFRKSTTEFYNDFYFYFDQAFPSVVGLNFSILLNPQGFNALHYEDSDEAIFYPESFHSAGSSYHQFFIDQLSYNGWVYEQNTETKIFHKDGYSATLTVSPVDPDYGSFTFTVIP
jgi:hypothetical protein